MPKPIKSFKTIQLIALILALVTFLSSCSITPVRVNDPDQFSTAAPSASKFTETPADQTEFQTPEAETPGPTSGNSLYGEIPVLRIETENRTAITSNEDYIGAEVSVEDGFGQKGIGAVIRGHGNTTWRDFKNIKASYRLKLDSKTNLAGMPGDSGKDYVLLANHSDVTMLRNYIALSLAQKLENLSFVPRCKYVWLVLNGKDKGLYLLCTKVKIGDGRVDIESDDTGTEIDTGYLLELDKRAPEDDDPYINISGTKYMLSVKIDNPSAEQLDYISKCINDFYKALRKGNREEIEALADMDSIVDMFILEEFTKDRDAGFASFYIIKRKGGKIEFGPPWDFDLALGNDRDNVNPSGLITEVTDSQETNANPFFVLLLRQNWFRKLVRDRYSEVKEPLITVANDSMKMAEFLKDANAANNELYHVYGRKIFKEPSFFVTDLKNYEDHVEYLQSWMLVRADWLDWYFTEKTSS